MIYYSDVTLCKFLVLCENYCASSSSVLPEQNCAKLATEKLEKMQITWRKKHWQKTGVTQRAGVLVWHNFRLMAKSNCNLITARTPD